MQLAVALYSEDNIQAERVIETVCDEDRQEFLTLAVELRRLVEIAVREHMTFLWPSVLNDETASRKIEQTRHQMFIQNMPDACQLRFQQLLELHWNALTKAAKNTTFSLPRLQQLHWKVAVKSEEGKRVLMRLQTSDGETRTIHVPMEQFHQLRYNVAMVLQEMNEVEMHPMMRLAHMEQTNH
ncbi:unnamed protein product [Peronospora belbahrii]|uniref:COMM domain-containing protein 5 n=1 Tax=Peronospora belbahrii TaxID=622444 RepID=A0AAU9KY98_9STRA|nr:unnamed protein product [Peronospora belbahrii]CAH0478744.1 unnamed protein product [Peronospora belbahrii]CAH0521965.1 unnamed protein product [Peronospora belbahrii]